MSPTREMRHFDHESARLSPRSAPSQQAGASHRLYANRWVQLFYLSGAALISDLSCFAIVAADAEDVYRDVYSRDPANLVDFFLLANVIFCALEPIVVKRCGYRAAIVGGTTLMAVGCTLRAGLPFLSRPPYWALVLGTVFVGAAQPFFQCTPPLLSQRFFGASERALATAVSINSNQIGIMIAFILGAWIVTDAAGLSTYLGGINIAAWLLALGAACHVKERPPTPPSASAAAALAAESERRSRPSGMRGSNPTSRTGRLGGAGLSDVAALLSTLRELLRTPGFLQPVVAVRWRPLY